MLQSYHQIFIQERINQLITENNYLIYQLNQKSAISIANNKVSIINVCAYSKIPFKFIINVVILTFQCLGAIGVM